MYMKPIDFGAVGQKGGGRGGNEPLFCCDSNRRACGKGIKIATNIDPGLGSY